MSFHQDFSHYKVPAGKTFYRSNSELCKSLEMPFKEQARNLLPQTKPLMWWGCCAPAHSLTSHTRISDVIWELLPPRFLAQSIAFVAAIKKTEELPQFFQLASLQQYPYSNGFLKYLNAKIPMLLGTLIMPLTKGCPEKPCLPLLHHSWKKQTQATGLFLNMATACFPCSHCDCLPRSKSCGDECYPYLNLSIKHRPS